MKNRLFLIVTLFSMSNFMIAMEHNHREHLNKQLINEMLKSSFLSKDDVATIKNLIQQGADVNLILNGMYNPIPCKHVAFEHTPILESCLSYPGILICALQHNADIEMPNSKGQTLIVCSFLKREFEAFKVLLDHGANSNVLDKYGTSLFEECRSTYYPSYFNRYFSAFCIPFRFEKYISPSLRRDPSKALEIINIKQNLNEKITKLGDVSFFHA